MSKIKNRDELSDFWISLMNSWIWMIANSASKSSAQLQIHSSGLQRVKWQNRRCAPHLSHHSAPLDTYDMIIKQPAKLTVDCLQDFGMIEDCIYARSAMLKPSNSL